MKGGLGSSSPAVTSEKLNPSGLEPLDPAPDFSRAVVHVLDEDQSSRDPREVMIDLLRDRSPARDP
jgi:hypothetical protein